MATFKIKRYSNNRRKLFGLGDVAQGAVDTTRNVVGGTISGAGSIIDSGAGRTVGGLAGAGAALGTAGLAGAGIGAAIEGGGGLAKGAVIGGLAGTLLTPILPGIGTMAGAGIGAAMGGLPGAVSGAAKGVKTVGKLGYDVGSSATGAAGEALKGIGNSIQTRQ